MTKELLPKILAVMANVFEVPIESLNENSSPDTVASWDSLKHMNLVLELERVLDIRFNAEDIMEMMNVELIVEIASRHVKAPFRERS